MVKQEDMSPPDGTLTWFQGAFAKSGWQNAVASKEDIGKIIGIVETGLKEGGLAVSVNAGYAPAAINAASGENAKASGSRGLLTLALYVHHP